MKSGPRSPELAHDLHEILPETVGAGLPSAVGRLKEGRQTLVADVDEDEPASQAALLAAARSARLSLTAGACFKGA